MKKLINFDIGITGLMFQYSDDFDLPKLTIISCDIIKGDRVYIPTKTIVIPNNRAIVNLLNQLHKIDFEVKDNIKTFGVGIMGIICQYFFDDSDHVELIIGEGDWPRNKSTTITIKGVANIKRLITKLENIVEGFDIDEN